MLFLLSPSTQAEEDVITQLVPCIIQVESGGNPNAIGSSGEIGLMQISSIVLKEHNYCLQKQKGEIDTESGGWESKHLFNPEINKLIGTWYLHRLHEHYNCNTIEKILAGYNYGPTALKKVNYDISRCPRSVRRYIKKVKEVYGNN